MNTTLPEPEVIPGCTIATAVVTPPPNEIHDEAEQVLLAFDENERALNALVNAENQWKRELAAFTEREEGLDESSGELDRLARLEDELRHAPSKIRALLKRQASLKRKLNREFGIRWQRVSELAHECARELEVRLVQRLEKIYCDDRQAATQAARLHPDLARCLDRCEVQLLCIDRIDPVIGTRQLLKLQAEIVAEARELARK